MVTTQLESPIFDPLLAPIGYSLFKDSNIIQKGNYTVDHANLKGPVYDMVLTSTIKDNAVIFRPRLLNQDSFQIQYESYNLVVIKGFSFSGRKSLD